MNRAQRAALVATAAAGALALAFAPSAIPQAKPTAGTIDVAAAITRVCPVVDPQTAASTVLVANARGSVKAQELTAGNSQTSVSPGSLAIFEHARMGVQTDVAPGGRGGATTQTALPSGLERGLTANSCATPTNTAWFPTVESSATAQSSIYLTSVDDGGASVDLAFYGPQGRIDAAGVRSISVKPHSTQVVALSGIVDMNGPFAVQATVSSGRVAAFARVRHLGGAPTDPGTGTDWEASAPGPATQNVVPDVPSGDGDRMLTVFNPGERAATYSYDFVGTDGVTSSGGDTLSVSSGTIATVPVTGITKGRAGSIVVHSDLGVVAAVTSSVPKGDFAISTAQAPFSATSVTPLQQGDGRAVLQLTALADAEVSIQTTDANGTLLGQGITQRIPAKTTWALPLAAGSTIVPTVTVNAGAIYGGVVLTRDLGGFPGITQLPLGLSEGGRTGVNPRDAHTLG